MNIKFTFLAARTSALLIGLETFILPSEVKASNFGDLPSVLPIFWLAVIASVVVAFWKARDATKQESEGRSSVGTFLGIVFAGLFASLILLVILFLFTF